MPRSLAFCQWEIAHNLGHLSRAYETQFQSQELAAEIMGGIEGQTIDGILAQGLHEFITEFLAKNRALAARIETDYSFYA